MTDEPKSALTVQSAWQRILLKAPPGPGRSRHVSLEELQEFIDRAKAEGKVMCAGREEHFERWIKGHNVALMDSQLYVDSPWGEKHD